MFASKGKRDVERRREAVESVGTEEPELAGTGEERGPIGEDSGRNCFRERRADDAERGGQPGLAAVRTGDHDETRLEEEGAIGGGGAGKRLKG